jgi:hypothetical protein
MISKIINKILSVLFLTDYAINIYLVLGSIIVGGSITDYYTGIKLISFISKISIHAFLGFSVVVVLFFNRVKAIYVLLPLYISEIFLSKYWQIEPNTPKFQKMLERVQHYIQTEQTIHSDVKATFYPFSWMYVFYLLSIIYIYFVMPKLSEKNKQKIQSN